MDNHFPQYLSNWEADLLITIEREMSDASKVFVEGEKRKALAKSIISICSKTGCSIQDAMDMVSVEESDKEDVLKQISLLDNRL